MARLKDMLPPGEFVRWRSPKPETPWSLFGWGVLAGLGLAASSSLIKKASEPGILLFAAIGVAGIGLLMAAVRSFECFAAKLAITEGNVVWVDATPGRGGSSTALRDIMAVDVEEGGAALNLYCGGTSHRIEEVRGDIAAAVRAMGRPARIWRECRSGGAAQAKRWQLPIGVGAGALSAAGIIGLLHLGFGGDVFEGFAGAVLLGLVGLPAHWFGEMAKRTVPHLLVGRRLSGEARCDFVGWMTDLRWRGVKLDGPDDERLPRSRLAEWAMRKAYGEIPDIGEREPEVLIPGKFPGGPGA